jgi:succinate dehydrogenase / fumarate reductase membrane anchor subunit
MGSGTQIGAVRGLGAGGQHATRHWMRQRLTAASNFLLLAWFVISLIRLPSLDHATVTEWLKQPLVAVPMLLVIASVFTHFRLGLQVFIEDYVHEEGNKLLCLAALNGYAIAGAAVAAFCVLKIAFGS